MAKENLIVPMEDSSTPAPAEESRPGDKPMDSDA